MCSSGRSRAARGPAAEHGVRTFMDVPQEYRRQVALIKWINDHHVGTFSVTRKDHLALASFDLAIEHHAAICTLCNAQLYKAMFALLRVAFEAYARGLWLRHVATEKDVEGFCGTKERIPSLADLLDSVERQLEITRGPLTTLKTKSWPIFCSFTHTGCQALLRRMKEKETGGVNYDAAQLVTALRLAGAFALLSAMELATLAGDEKRVQMTLAMAKEYA